MPFEALLAELEKRHPKQVDLGLERVGAVAEKLKLTTFDVPVIMVAGTNGKGSCVRVLEQVYLQAGYTVAASTSPHLIHFNERLRLNGSPVDDALLEKCFTLVDEAAGDIYLSYFEFALLAILLAIQWVEPDIILLEVGVGGRLDATNVVAADVAVITSIALDHMDYLGDTRDAIAAEKAGIMRTGKPCVCADIDPPQSIFTHAEGLPAPVVCANRDYFIHDLGKTWHFVAKEQSYFNLPKPKLLLQNAGAALMAVTCLQAQLPVTQDHIVSAIDGLALVGRQQWLPLQVPCLFDVAHNPAAVRSLAASLPTTPGRTLAVCGMLNTKDYQASLAPLNDEVDQWFFATLEAEKSLPPEWLAACVKTPSTCYATVTEAFQAALDAASPEDRIIAFGSFYVVGALFKRLEAIK